MAEPLKNLFSAEVIRAMAHVLERIDRFDRGIFEQVALAGLDDLEMMARAAQITQAMKASIPGDFEETLPALFDVLHPDYSNELDGSPPDARGLRGWSLVPVGSFVAENGLDRPQESLRFLAEMTKRFSAEFAVRPFFRDHPDKTLNAAMTWASDADHHVRRLASEGSRPRLPWGIRLQDFVRDPAPVLPILQALRDDPSEYVRRSVANNLNDIAKDHPKLVNQIAAGWMDGADRNRQRLVKHACRSLIKSGDPDTLAIFGFGKPEQVEVTLDATKSVVLGDCLNVSVTLHNTAPQPLAALIDLAVGFRKADGRLSPKVFKWTETELAARAVTELTKSLPLRPVTTRVHYPGEHSIAVQVNGAVLARDTFELLL